MAINLNRNPQRHPGQSHPFQNFGPWRFKNADFYRLFGRSQALQRIPDPLGGLDRCDSCERGLTGRWLKTNLLSSGNARGKANANAEG